MENKEKRPITGHINNSGLCVLQMFVYLNQKRLPGIPTINVGTGRNAALIPTINVGTLLFIGWERWPQLEQRKKQT